MGFKYVKFSTYFQGNRHYGKKFPLQSSEKYQPKNLFPLYWKAFEIYIRYSDGKFLFELLHNYL